MNVRKYKIGDFFKIREIMLECANESSEFMMVRPEEVDMGIHGLLSASKDITERTFVAEVDREVIGVGMVTPGILESDRLNAEVSLAVSMGHRRSGAGREIMNRMISEFGHMNLWADVVETNAPVIALLESAGYELTATLPKFVNTQNGPKDKHIFIYKG